MGRAAKDMKRRVVLGLVGAFLYSMVGVISYAYDYLVMPFDLLVTGLVVFWLGYILITFAVLLNKTSMFKDPSLTMMQMVWCIIFISYFLYFAVEARAALLLAYLSIMPFGAFRLGWRGFFGVSFFTIACYSITLFFVLQKRPGYWILELELLIGVSFILAMFGYATLGREFSSLRYQLTQKNRQLTRALSKIEELAITDELTGLYNRRYLVDMLNKRRAVANRDGSTFVLAFIDLDHFKEINDNYGHHVGDEVLKEFSSLLEESIREVDVAARYGGEEFVVLLNNIDLHVARHVCDRIHSSVLENRFAKLNLPVTVSIGVAQYQNAETVLELVGRADALLYKAKQTGRNCIKYDDETPLYSMPGKPASI